MVITAGEFMVVEQRSGLSYIPHVFDSEAHYKAWQRRHRLRNMRARVYARGRMLDPVDHRGEVELEPVDTPIIQPDPRDGYVPAWPADRYLQFIGWCRYNRITGQLINRLLGTSAPVWRRLHKATYTDCARFLAQRIQQTQALVACLFAMPEELSHDQE